jgi:Type II CAAX prenyl endopeptidase Rce1-like
MLFLLKRSAWTGAVALVVLASVGVGLRCSLGASATPLNITFPLIFIGISVAAAVIVCDGVIHNLLVLVFRGTYARRFRELTEVFRGQSYTAIFMGALLAGIGEELVFRGLGTSVWYLFPAAVVFGLLHHIRRSLWPFTLWSILEGCLFALALWWWDELVVTMVAHFLHDVIGFLIFKVELHKADRLPSPRPLGERGVRAFVPKFQR